MSQALSICAKQHEQPQVLVLESQLAEIRRAHAWSEAIANWAGANADTRYAISLCLEEVLANIVLHGYQSEPGHPIVLRSWVSNNTLSFAVEDKAPHFALEDAPAKPASQLESFESFTPGGFGVQLLRHFAGSLAYERLPEGNQLTISFLICSAPSPLISTTL